MASAKTILEAEIYGALAASIAGATVYQDVPENEPFPIVMIGEMRSQPLGAKDDSDRRITVTIVALASAEERAPVLALMEQIETALDKSRFAAGGWTFGGTFIDDEAALAEDGTSYVGSVVFEFLALKD